MIPHNHWFGQFVYLIEQNSSFQQIEEELKTKAVSWEKIYQPDYDLYHFVMSKNFFGFPKKTIVVGVFENKLDHIMIITDNKNEYVDIRTILIQHEEYYKLINSNRYVEIYSSPRPNVFIQIGQWHKNRAHFELSIVKGDLKR